MNAFTYLKLHWRGELPFDLAYLANYLLVLSLVVLGLWQMESHLDWNESLTQRAVIVYCVCFSLFIFIWSAIGVLRTLLKIEGKPMIFVAYVVFALSSVRFLRYLLKIAESYSN